MKAGAGLIISEAHLEALVAWAPAQCGEGAAGLVLRPDSRFEAWAQPEGCRIADLQHSKTVAALGGVQPNRWQVAGAAHIQPPVLQSRIYCLDGCGWHAAPLYTARRHGDHPVTLESFQILKYDIGIIDKSQHFSAAQEEKCRYCDPSSQGI